MTTKIMPADNTKADDLKEVIIYTDGGAMPNPGRGGYGVVLRFGPHSKELSAGYKHTTNNRMELMAVIAGLEALKERCRVKLHSDSKYIVDAIQNGSAFRWRENDWSMNASGSKKAKNPDLWQRLLDAFDKHVVEMVWVKGHAGINDNERCDELATAAVQQRELLKDEGYKPGDETEFITANGNSQITATKAKMTEVGEPCRKCSTPVIKRVPKKKTIKPNRTYYYAWYLFCPGCKSAFMVEKARREVSDDDGRLLDEKKRKHGA